MRITIKAEYDVFKWFVFACKLVGNVIKRLKENVVTGNGLAWIVVAEMRSCCDLQYNRNRLSIILMLKNLLTNPLY